MNIVKRYLSENILEILSLSVIAVLLALTGHIYIAEQIDTGQCHAEQDCWRDGGPILKLSLAGKYVLGPVGLIGIHLTGLAALHKEHSG
ncbi:hypothetical protein ON05_037200 (plasmid) [Acaryochloris sp. CCMEE 5410]|nr:hypothetical protein ON05_037200 [Acaryochloris sp. CCMEE 5410]